MIIENLFNDVLLLKNDIFEDDRGSFSEIFNEKVFNKEGLNNHFLQDNISFSKDPGTIRGLHFQSNPFSQGKLLRVIKGSIEDFFIDLRRSSSTYEKFSSIKLSYETGSIYIPKGFAHGFCTLEDNTCMVYLTSTVHSPKNDGGVLFDSFGFSWPIAAPINSGRDLTFPSFKDFNSPF